MHMFLIYSDSFALQCSKRLDLFLLDHVSYLALVSTQVVPAGRTVLAGAGVALIQLHLAVTACVAHLALAVVCLPNVEATTRVLAQLVHRDS